MVARCGVRGAGDWAVPEVPQKGVGPAFEQEGEAWAAAFVEKDGEACRGLDGEG